MRKSTKRYFDKFLVDVDNLIIKFAGIIRNELDVIKKRDDWNIRDRYVIRTICRSENDSILFIEIPEGSDFALSDIALNLSRIKNINVFPFRAGQLNNIFSINKEDFIKRVNSCLGEDYEIVLKNNGGKK